MNIEINDARTIQDIQEEFADEYPFLKIEFFARPHEQGVASDEQPHSPGHTIGSIRNRHTTGTIDVGPDSPTGAVEQEFEQRFDLHVQIYRLQADKWLQTAGTDILTLHEQNEIGKDASIFYNPDHQFSEDSF